jgi:C4-dicarboxylate-specific signal transduction histidine kinase
LIVSGIPNELTQVFLNLFQNAKDAFGKKPEDEQKWLRIYISRDEECAVISVEDNAGGIRSDALEQIFEPYFTTKHSSHGTGLGLFMSRMIIQKSFRGSLEAVNSLKGALFIIKIPLNHEEKESDGQE